MNTVKKPSFNAKAAQDAFKRSGRTKEWVAQYIGIERETLRTILNGKNVPSRPVVRLLAQAIECKETELLGGDQEAS